MDLKVEPPNRTLFDSNFQECVERFDEQMELMESIDFDIPKGALLMMEALEEAVDSAAKNTIVFDEIVDLRRKKVGIQMRKLRWIFSTSENPTKSDLEWRRILEKTIQILEEKIAELEEDFSPSCHYEAANPVDVDEDNSNVETKYAPTSSGTR